MKVDNLHGNYQMIFQLVEKPALEISPKQVFLQAAPPQHKRVVGVHGGDGATPVVSSPAFVP